MGDWWCFVAGLLGIVDDAVESDVGVVVGVPVSRLALVFMTLMTDS